MKAKILSITLMMLLISSLNTWGNEVIAENNSVEAAKEYNGLIIANVSGIPIPLINQTVVAEDSSCGITLTIKDLSILSYVFGTIVIECVPVDTNGNIIAPYTSTVDVPGLGTFPLVVNGNYVNNTGCSLNLTIQGTPSGNITVTYTGTPK